MSDGFVIMAQNTHLVDYVKCAEQLRDSIKRVMPNSNVTIITSDMLPYGDLAPNSDWKLINDWQVYEASPYDRTIKLEADMYVPEDISHWFDILSNNHVTVCNKIRNYKGSISNVRAYRSFIDANHLPDVYNAMTYFDKSDFSKQFFAIVKDVFDKWDHYVNHLNLQYIDNTPTTDFVYSIACHIMGEEKTTLPCDSFSMVHMKQFINDTATDDWTNELIYEFEPLRIQTFVQQYPVHYHIKHFSSKIEQYYG